MPATGSIAMMHSAEPDELVTVFRSSDPVMLTLIRSILEEAGMEIIMRGEGALQGLLPSMASFPLEIQVYRDNAEEALALLAEITAEQNLPDNPEGDERIPGEES